MDIGIDLGTTFSVVAVNGRVELAADYPAQGIYLDACDVTIIPAPDGDMTFPSVMLEDPDHPGQYLFGSAALQRSEEGHAPVLFSKRKIGTKEAIPLITHTLMAKEVAREFLRYLKRCAEQALGVAVKRAVVTHPAYFDRSAVEETRQAAIEAGFDMALPEQLLMEPVAAALTYTRTDRRDPLRILTYDLGGGTFDVTYLERRSGVIDMRAFDGDHLLGGYNFDREIVHWVRKRLESQGRQIVLDEEDAEDRARLARLLRIAENVKIALAQVDDAKPVEYRGRGILVDTNGKPVQILERLTRQQFVDLIRPLLDRTVECCKRTLRKADVESGAVDELLLVGGSTYGPWVAESLSAAFPNLKPKLFYPDLCVAAGAAIQAKMALPPLVAQAEYQLVLDVAEVSVLDRITVTGRITSSQDVAEVTGLAASLHTPEGTMRGPQALSAQGRFLFDEVELREGEPNPFTLSVTDAAGQMVMKHTFQVQYAPDYAETSAVTTVLPKPLYILTLNGLIPLAAEGARLPARCRQTFQRINDNPNMSLKLFQESDAVGEIRIEGIPAEGGRGSLVDLEIEVTEKNQIRGQAIVRTRNNKVVARSQISVYFEVPELPAAAALRQQFERLKDEAGWQAAPAVVTDSEGLQAACASLIQQIERQFEQQPLERQEIHIAVRRLDALMHPPEDEMVPTRREFLRQIGDCRIAVEEMAEKARGQLAGKKTGHAVEPLDQTVVKAAEATLRKADYFRSLMEGYEREGLASHERRDRKAWAIINDNLADLEAQVRERPDLEGLPTYVLKLVAIQEVMAEIVRLDGRADAIARNHQLQDWEGTIHSIRQRLDAVLQELDGIDNALPSAQGLAQIRLIFTQKVQPLRQAIEELGETVTVL